MKKHSIVILCVIGIFLLSGCGAKTAETTIDLVKRVTASTTEQAQSLIDDIASRGVTIKSIVANPPDANDAEAGFALLLFNIDFYTVRGEDDIEYVLALYKDSKDIFIFGEAEA